MNWKGVLPAITTSFTEDLRVDHSFLTKHCHWLLDNGCADTGSSSGDKDGSLVKAWVNCVRSHRFLSVLSINTPAIINEQKPVGS